MHHHHATHITKADDEIVFQLGGTERDIPMLTFQNRDDPYGPRATITLVPALMGGPAGMADWLDQLAYTARMGAQAVRALG